MKKLIFLIIALSSIVYSQDYNLNINLDDGTTVTISVDDIQRIEFENVTDIEDAEKLQQVIESFILKQNYPNPFNPSTTIEYQIPGTSTVNVSIFNINGQLVKELVNESQSQGVYKITWNGTNQSNAQVASGIYIYTIRFGGQLLSRQMILIK